MHSSTSPRSSTNDKQQRNRRAAAPTSTRALVLAVAGAALVLLWWAPALLTSPPPPSPEATATVAAAAAAEGATTAAAPAAPPLPPKPQATAAATAAAAAEGKTTMAAAAPPAERAARARGAILGALVADAATMPLHWIYSQEAMAELLAKRPPAFYDPPSCRFYSMPLGALSPYGAETAAALRFLARDAAAAAQVRSGAVFDGQAWAAALAGYFGEGGPYAAGYKNKSIKTLLANLAEGKRFPDVGDAGDTQANSLCKLAVVAAAYGGRRDDALLTAAVDAAVRAQQANDTSVELAVAAGKILARVVEHGASVPEALRWAASSDAAELPGATRQLVADAVAFAEGGGTLAEAAAKFGVSCAMPGALQVALVAAAQNPSSYRDAVNQNAAVGGDNASRACFLGALLGAAVGPDGIPAEWREKTAAFAEFSADADALVAAAATSA